MCANKRLRHMAKRVNKRDGLWDESDVGSILLTVAASLYEMKTIESKRSQVMHSDAGI